LRGPTTTDNSPCPLFLSELGRHVHCGPTTTFAEACMVSTDGPCWGQSGPAIGRSRQAVRDPERSFAAASAAHKSVSMPPLVATETSHHRRRENLAGGPGSNGRSSAKVRAFHSIVASIDGPIRPKRRYCPPSAMNRATVRLSLSQNSSCGDRDVRCCRGPSPRTYTSPMSQASPPCAGPRRGFARPAPQTRDGLPSACEPELLRESETPA
jgi:hypothetical protein